MYDTDTFVPSVDGRLISERIARISEIIQDYDPTFELVWIPPEHRSGLEKPFAVRHNPPGLPSYTAFFLNEDEVDHRVLARLWENDATKHDILSRLEREEKAAEAVRLKERLDAAEERQAFVAAAVGSSKTYRHNGVAYR